MNVDLSTAKESLVRHYAFLAADPGWSKYVEARLQDMAEGNPELFGDMPRLVHEAMEAGCE